jgi:hypothetical protein
MVMMTMVVVMAIAMMVMVIIVVTDMLDFLRGAGRVRMTLCSLVLLRDCG